METTTPVPVSRAQLVSDLRECARRSRARYAVPPGTNCKLHASVAWVDFICDALEASAGLQAWEALGYSPADAEQLEAIVADVRESTGLDEQTVRRAVAATMFNEQRNLRRLRALVQRVRHELARLGRAILGRPS